MTVRSVTDVGLFNVLFSIKATERLPSVKSKSKGAYFYLLFLSSKHLISDEENKLKSRYFYWKEPGGVDAGREEPIPLKFLKLKMDISKTFRLSVMLKWPEMTLDPISTPILQLSRFLLKLALSTVYTTPKTNETKQHKIAPGRDSTNCWLTVSTKYSKSKSKYSKSSKLALSKLPDSWGSTW